MAKRNLRVLLKKIYSNGDIDNIFFKTRAKDVIVSEDGTETLLDIATKVQNSASGATKTEESNTNGNLKINGTEVNVYEHPTSGATAGTYNSVTVDANGHVTKGANITDWTGTVSGNISNGVNTLTQATTRANLTSGEKLSTSLGKIMKWFADLGSMAFASNVGTANLDTTLTTFYNTAITTDNVTDSTSITADGWVADAKAVANLQNQITTINSNLGNHTHYQGELEPSCINFRSLESTDGGKINFFFNGSSNYTSNICEAAAGLVKLNGHEILTKDHFITLMGSALTFSNGVATYSNSKITASSFCFAQRNSVSADTEFAFVTRCTAGKATIATSKEVSVTLNMNILIFIS